MKRYAGVGPRNTPPDMLEKMTLMASILSQNGHHLVSGHGDGADQAWEKGASPDHQTVWIPWAGFNGANHHPAFKVVTNPKTMEIAQHYHPMWSSLTQGARKLMARNVAILYGNDLDQQVEFILYWQKTNINRYKGGTGHTLRVADAYEIPSFNIASDQEITDLGHFLQYELLERKL